MSGNAEQFAHGLVGESLPRRLFYRGPGIAARFGKSHCSLGVKKSRGSRNDSLSRIVITSAVFWREGSAVRREKQIPPRAEALVVMTNQSKGAEFDLLALPKPSKSAIIIKLLPQAM